MHIFKTSSTQESCLTHASQHKSEVSHALRGVEAVPVKGPSVCRKGKDSRKGTAVEGSRENEKWPSMYYSVRTSFQKRLIRRETINVRGGRVNEGRESAWEDPIRRRAGFLISSPAGSESLNRATSSTS